MESYELRAVLNPYEILVLTPKGELRRLGCPFRVLCIQAIEELEHNSFCYVQKVEQVLYNSIYYRIGERYYPHTYFRIYVSF